MAGCVFCGIVAGEVPAFRVVDTDDGVAFLDTRPVFKGHVLVVPRTHLVTLADLPPESLAGYFGLVRRLAVAVESGLGAGGTFVAMNNKVSQSVPHLHTHVCPGPRATACGASSGRVPATPTTPRRPRTPSVCGTPWRTAPERARGG